MIKVLIVDAEQAMLAVMRRKLARTEGVVVAGSHRSAGEALEALRHEPAYLVFVTSHKNYAIDSFYAYPLDYLVKPVAQSRLERTVARVVARRREKHRTGSDRNSGRDGGDDSPIAALSGLD